MRFSPTLLYWLFRPVLGVSVLAGAILSAAALIQRDVLTDPVLPTLFAAIHAALLAVVLGRYTSGGFAFLHTRGFSRRTLFWHCNLAAGLGAGVVLVAAFLMVATPLRSYVQANVFQNPYGPFMYPRERVQVLWMAGAYALLLPVFQYAWIRRAQPTRGGSSGTLLAGVVAVTWLVLAGTLRRWPEGAGVVTWAVGAGIALTAVLAGARLYRRLEVRS